MRQVHLAGERLFVGFSGKRPSIADRKTGELVAVELFVGVLGASGYTYAEATATQKLHDWLGAHERMLLRVYSRRRTRALQRPQTFR